MKMEMKKEMRLIDANALLENLGEEPMVWSDGEAEIQERNDWQRFKACVEAQDTVDAVEVVRCKDCKWYNRNEDIMPQSGSCEFHEMVKMDWDFCSRAKMDAKE